MISDSDQLKKMLIRRLNTTKLKANDDLIDGLDVKAIKNYVLDKDLKEIEDDDITLWHHLMYSYEISKDSSFDEIVSALTLEQVFKSDPNSTAYKVLDTVMARIGTDTKSLLQKIMKEDQENNSIKEIDIKSLSEAI